MLSTQQLIQQYQLLPHPEGGYFAETYRAQIVLPHAGLHAHGFNGDRHCSTAIYFLLEAGQFSAFHKIKSDECWHFYAGQPLEIFMLHQQKLHIITLGNNPSQQQYFQFVVPANCWFASRPAKYSTYSFVGCTVAPGFDFNDFEMAKANELVAQYPEYADIIKPLCKL